MKSSLPAASISPDSPVVRRTANFHPSVWGDTFISYMSDETTLTRWREKAENLKRQIQEMLSVDETSNSTVSLSLIDAIQRLGIAYHFEEEIEKELARVFARFHDPNHHDHDDSYEDDLSLVSLRFRLLRQHGYNITCDVFKKFMDDNGNFKESIKKDVDGILSLYEAAQLMIHGEAILDLALSFAATCLRSVLPHLSPVYTKRVLHALNHPVHKWIPRLNSVWYFSIYNEMEQSNETLLEFSKLDFNIVQKLHQQELSNLSKWWKELEFASKLPFVRDRLVECYFWILGVYFEPKYTFARMFLTQVIAMASVVDDIYDAYGTKEELCLFTKAIDRWDEGAMVGLPEYMKLYYEALLDLYRNMEEEMTRQGRPTYGVQYAKEAGLIRAYFKERQWLDREDFPTVEEYMDVALLSCGYPMIAISSFVGMNDVTDEEAFKWLLKGPKISEAAASICRLMDDIVSHEFERERGHTPSVVECFSREHGVSEEEARDELRRKVESAWKDVNEEMMRPTPVARVVLMRLLNMCRAMEVLYNESDGYTHVNANTKEYIVSLLSTAAQV
ncbi:hypothetical protein V2J09_014054 [Rumex salicifolius]